VYFPVSGVHVSPLVPPLVGLALTTLCSLGGLSGAFALLPFQVSVLGFTGPAVTGTNHLFNVLASPAGIYGYLRERRMLWPLALLIMTGTVPGVVLGSLLRVRWLPDPRRFKLFVGLVLGLIGSRLLARVLRPGGGAPAPAGRLLVRTLRFDLRRLEYEYAGATHGVSTPLLLLLAVVVGVIGGAYGVGGGAILSPFLISIFGLPVHTIAGATLAGTCATSLVGVGFFSLGGHWLGAGLAPDWALGALFGAGGLVGMYGGSRLQRRVRARLIEAALALVVLGLAVSYVAGFFLGAARWPG